MAITRSPRYPSVSLERAIALTNKLWLREKKTPVSSEIVARAWDYKGVSGIVRAQIGALRQYGLLDSAKEGLRVSDLAVEILAHPKDSEDYRRAVARAALNPPLFSEIYRAFPDASNDSIRANLITKKGFSPEAADKFISSLRDTLSFASPGPADYTDAESTEDRMAESEVTEMPAAAAFPFGRPREAAPAPAAKASGLSLTVPFKGSYLNVRIDAPGQQLTKAHVARVRAYLEMAEDDLEDGASEPA